MKRGATFTAKKPCTKCGSPLRYVSTGACVPCARASAKRQRERASLPGAPL